jgi:DNA-3-methyladenine glycosylase II
MDSTTLRKAERHLAKADPVMARLIKHNGPCTLGPSTGSLFHSLASAIIAQQLSVKAADTIQRRVMKLTSKPMTPAKLLAASDDALRAAGLSRSKASYIRNLAVAMGEGLSRARLKNMDDPDAIAALSAVKGIGQWTAEMYLIFGLNRMDIMSLGDAGLQRAARELYNGGTARDGLLASVSEKWKPYRSVAAWYLWLGLD